jgi:hypothetical protein
MATAPGNGNHDTLPDRSQGECSQEEPEDHTETSITVHRRFSHFTTLYQILTTTYPALVIRPLPPKTYFPTHPSETQPDAEFLSTRTRDLGRWLRGVVRHPVLRGSEGVVAFLGCDEDVSGVLVGLGLRVVWELMG